MSDFHDAALTTPQFWRRAFDGLVRSRMEQPFEWGRNDCCLFAADAVLASTGRDLAERWRGTYNSAAGAARLVAQFGGLEAIGDLAGPRVPPLAAQVGDVGLVSDGEREVLAMCVGSTWLMPTARGLGPLPLDAARLAWRVGHE